MMALGLAVDGLKHELRDAPADDRALREELRAEIRLIELVWVMIDNGQAREALDALNALDRG